MPTSEARRVEIEKLRMKAATVYDLLMEALDDDGHDHDCVLRCIEQDCDLTHSCDVCREDGEI